MKVLLISHTSQSRTEGQPKAQCLGQLPGVQLRLVVPDRWKHYGRWRAAEPPVNPSFQYSAERVRWPWLGPAQYYMHWYPRLREILCEFRPDVIDLWEEPWGLVSAHACRLRDRYLPNTRIISETEQNQFKRLPPPFEQMRKYVLRRADFVVGRSAEAIEVVRRKGYTGPAAVVPNAVDTALFARMDRAACRAELQLSGFVVGYVGRLVREKGILDLIDAVAGCSPDVNLLIVGGGPLEAEVRRHTQSTSLAGRVRLLPARALEQLPRVFNAMDVLALPSRTTSRWKEQFGRVIIEAQACGVPVLGSSSGAIPDVVGDGGLIVSEGVTREHTCALQRLHDDTNLVRRLGARGLANVRTNCTWMKVAEQMRDIYTNVLDGTAQRPVAARAESRTPSAVVPEPDWELAESLS